MPRLGKSGVRGLYKDGENWTIDLRWRDPATGDRKRHTEQLPIATGATAAKHRAREILNAALSGKFNPKQAKPRRLYELLDEYLKWSGTNTPKSLKSKRSRVNEIKAVLADRELAKVAAFTLEQFKRDRAAQVVKGARAVANRKGEIIRPAKPDHNVGPAAVNRALVLLKHALGLACDWGWITPTAQQDRALRKVKQLKEPKGRARDLLPDEEARLSAALPAGIRPIVETSIYSGMRRTECALLKKSAVNLATREINLEETKNGEARTVAMSDRVLAVVKRAMDASRCDYVFVSEDGAPYSPDSVSKAVRRAAEKLGIADLHLHDCRHAYGTRSRRAGVELDVLAKQMGHKSIRMTMRYARASTAQQHEAVATLAHASGVASQLPDQHSDDPKKLKDPQPLRAV